MAVGDGRLYRRRSHLAVARFATRNPGRPRNPGKLRGAFSFRDGVAGPIAGAKMRPTRMSPGGPVITSLTPISYSPRIGASRRHRAKEVFSSTSVRSASALAP